MNRAAFYAALRGTVIAPHGLSQDQVNGLERLLNVWDKYYANNGRNILAYDLATSYHETGHQFQPVVEDGNRHYFDKYEPGTKLGKMLGNTQPGDGYRYRGEGDVQNTGRRNAAFSSKRLNEVFGLNVDFVSHPELRSDPVLSAHCLFLGNNEGWWTGRDLQKYIDNVDESDTEDLREFMNARAVINGSDKAQLIGSYALVFEKALKAAGV